MLAQGLGGNECLQTQGNFPNVFLTNYLLRRRHCNLLHGSNKLALLGGRGSDEVMACALQRVVREFAEQAGESPANRAAAF